jgi:hypothetical protein
MPDLYLGLNSTRLEAMPPEAMDDEDGGSGLRIEGDSQTSAA